MPTERLYYTDSYLTEFRGTIAVVEKTEGGYRTSLDRSAFYPTSGGQQHDLGTLGTEPVTDVQDVEGEVWHLTPVPIGQVGDQIEGRIDTIRRRRHRQIHTAQHVVSAVLLRDFDAETTSVHLGSEYGAIDVEKGNLSEVDIPTVNKSLQVEIEAALPIAIHFAEGDEIDRFPLRRPPKKSGRIRIVAIGELDFSACGGTHCRSTAELISIRVTGIERRHGKQSVTFIAADQFLDDYETRYQATVNLARRFNCQVGQLINRIDSLELAHREIRHQYDAAIKELIPIWANDAIVASNQTTSQNLVVVHRPTLSKDQARELGNVIVSATSGLVLVACSEATLLVSGSVQHSARHLLAKLLAEFGLRGGGTDQLAQTSVLTSEQLIAFEERLRGLLL